MTETPSLIYTILCLFFVIGLILLAAYALPWGMRLAQKRGLFRNAATSDGRLKVLESLVIDPQRRLVLLRRDDQDHLLLLTETHSLVIESLSIKENCNS